MSAYASTAPFFDALAGDEHCQLNERIAAELEAVDVSTNPIVDIGAGTGLTTRAIARVCPAANILALEPDAAMLPALMATVCADEDLRRRVSILPMAIADAPLPSTIAAVAMAATLVHFSPDARIGLWELLASRLQADGVAVFDIQCALAQDIAEFCVARATVGRIEYESWAAATRLDEQRLMWRLRYSARLDGMEIDRREAQYPCWVASVEKIVSEVEAAGLRASVADNLVALRPRR